RYREAATDRRATGRAGRRAKRELGSAGISWTLPPRWSKTNVTTDSAQYSVGTEAFLIASISAMGSDFPTDISLRGFHQGAQVRKKNGQVDELKWLEIDGVKGVEFRESKPEDPDGIRRLQ